MSELANGEEEFLSIYREMNVVEGGSISGQNIAVMGRKLMSPPNFKNAQEIANALEEKGVIEKDLRLTKLGEDAVYPEAADSINLGDPDHLSSGEAEFLSIYREMNVTEGGGISQQNISAVGRKLMSPPNFRDVQEIANALESKGYISKDLTLTKKGEDCTY